MLLAVRKHVWCTFLKSGEWVPLKGNDSPLEGNGSPWRGTGPLEGEQVLLVGNRFFCERKLVPVEGNGFPWRGTIPLQRGMGSPEDKKGFLR